MTCTACGVEMQELALSCPGCRRLTHAPKLEALAQRAQAAWRVGKFREERELWGESLKLLPEDTVQYRSIHSRINEINRQAQGIDAPGDGWKKASAGIGPVCS